MMNLQTGRGLNLVNRRQRQAVRATLQITSRARGVAQERRGEGQNAWGRLAEEVDGWRPGFQENPAAPTQSNSGVRLSGIAF
jgi:hypothetical protein